MVLSRSVNIMQPVSRVYDYVKMTRNQDNFSVWNMQDPNMDKQYSGTDGEKGFIYRWNSTTNKNVGEGEQEILSLVDNSQVNYEVRFSRPMKSVARTGFSLNVVSPDQTAISWNFSSPMKFPMTLFKGPFSKMLIKDIQKGLDNLKEILEKQA